MSDTRDVDAWKLAIEMMRKSGELVWVNEVERELRTKGLAKTGKWAARAMQARSLRLAPWQVAPAEIKDADIEEIIRAGPDDQDHRATYSAAILAKRMRLNGISRWHPDPESAIAAIKSAKVNA